MDVGFLNLRELKTGAASYEAWGSFSAGLAGARPIMHFAFSFVIPPPPFPMEELLDDLFSDDKEQEAAVEVDIAAATTGGAALKTMPAAWRGRLVRSASNISRGASF